MQNQKTRKRRQAFLGIELNNRFETAAVIGTMILFALAAVIAARIIS